MNRIVIGLVIFAGVFFMLLGAIFFIASGTDNIIPGAVLVLIATLVRGPVGW